MQSVKKKKSMEEQGNTQISTFQLNIQTELVSWMKKPTLISHAAASEQTFVTKD